MTNIEYIRTLDVFELTDWLADQVFPPDGSGIVDLRRDSPIMKFYDKMIKFLMQPYDEDTFYDFRAS